jgi:predicted  nucleic acid-binding Zn-ribbon protein
MKKLASRINSQMETVRDIMEDLEIEFELLQNQISKLESKKGSREQQDEQLEVLIEDEDEIIDIENTSSVTVKQKF